MSLLPSPGRSAGKILRMLMYSALIVVVLLLAGRWLHYRLTHVHVVDARIIADMVTVSARLPGRITAMPVGEGLSIRSGDLLVALDNSQARQELRIEAASENALRGEGRRIKARLALARAVDSSRVAIAQRAVETAFADLQRLRVARDKARQDLGRLEGMDRNNLVSAQQMANSRYQLDKAVAEVLWGEAEQASAEARLAEAEAQTLNQQVLELELEVLQARLAEVRARQQQLEMDIADHRILSPLDGAVTRIFVEPGEYIQAGQNLMMVYDPQRIRVEANVKETAFARLRIGQPVHIRVDALPDKTFAGRVERIGTAATSEFALLPSPNPSGNFTKTTQRIPVRISIDRKDERLRPGLMVEAGIHVDN